MSDKFLVIDNLTGESIRVSEVFRIAEYKGAQYKSLVYVDRESFYYSTVDAKELTRRLNGG